MNDYRNVASDPRNMTSATAGSGPRVLIVNPDAKPETHEDRVEAALARIAKTQTELRSDLNAIVGMLGGVLLTILLHHFISLIP